MKICPNCSDVNGPPGHNRCLKRGCECWCNNPSTMHDNRYSEKCLKYANHGDCCGVSMDIRRRVDEGVFIGNKCECDCHDFATPFKPVPMAMPVKEFTKVTVSRKSPKELELERLEHREARIQRQEDEFISRRMRELSQIRGSPLCIPASFLVPRHYALNPEIEADLQGLKIRKPGSQDLSPTTDKSCDKVDKPAPKKRVSRKK